MNRTQRTCLIATAVAIGALCLLPPCTVENSLVGPGELGFVPIWELEQRIHQYRATVRIDGMTLFLRCACVLATGLVMTWFARSKPRPATAAPLASH